MAMCDEKELEALDYEMHREEDALFEELGDRAAMHLLYLDDMDIHMMRMAKEGKL